MTGVSAFTLEEATIDGIHAAYNAKTLTVRRLVEMYLKRIALFDKAGPTLNAIISLNPDALNDADRLDAAFASSGLSVLFTEFPSLGGHMTMPA